MGNALSTHSLVLASNILPLSSSTTVATTNGDNSEHDAPVREHLLWVPPPADRTLTEGEIDAYQVMCKSLATLARACYPPTALPQPSLVLSAAAASRDNTLQQGLETLHSAGHDITKALSLLAPNAAPVIWLDEMEEWSLPEGSLFEEALEKYGKSFYDIQSDFLPWKSAKVSIQYWYTLFNFVCMRKVYYVMRFCVFTLHVLNARIIVNRELKFIVSVNLLPR